MLQDTRALSRETMNRLQISKRKRTYLVRYITKHPGTHFSDIKRHFGYSTGSLVYQLEILLDRKEIFARYDGFWKRFYPISMRRRRKFVEITPTQEVIVKILVKYPGSSFMDIANRLGRTRQAIMYHLKNLVKEGIVKRKKSGRKYLYYMEN